MNGVLGTARLLQDTTLTSTQQHYVQVINRSGRSLLAILNDVLDYSKIEAGHLEIHHTHFDLYRLVSETHELMQSRAREKGITLTYHIDEDVTQYWQGMRFVSGKYSIIWLATGSSLLTRAKCVFVSASPRWARHSLCSRRFGYWDC